MKNGKTNDVETLSLLIKMMGMTTAAEDPIALMAIRKANEHLKKLGTDWDELLRGKITVIGDPFKGLQNPLAEGKEGPRYGHGASVPQRPAPAAPRPAPPPPQPRPAYQPPPPKQRNQYPGLCKHCSKLLQPQEGFLAGRNPTTGKHQIECEPGQCQPPKATKNQRPKVGGLADLLKGV